MLALQGAFQKHQNMLEELGVNSIAVRYEGDLDKIDGLILPGGESTTITSLLNTHKLWNAINIFVHNKPVFGTCAGAIMLSQSAHDKRVSPFGIMDVEAERNAYGRQIESFSTSINIDNMDLKEFHAVFIRAPRLRILSKDVEILATFNHSPVLVRQGRAIASTFHPELSQNLGIHKWFVNEIKHQKVL